MASQSTTDISLFGWDLTYSSVQKDIKTKEDLLIAIIHWSLVKSGFRCVGIGELMEKCESDVPSELLPKGWNSTKNYALRYLYQDQLYNLFLSKCSNGSVIVNVLQKTSKISSLEVKIDEVIQETSGQLQRMIPEYKDLILRIQNTLINGVTNEKKIANTQTQTSVETVTTNQTPFVSRDPFLLPGRVNVEAESRFRDLWNDPLADPRSVGRADLDPFGRGGGMIFAPPSNRPGVAGGSVPPGARFDPFRPQGVDPPFGPRRPPAPDADHFPPPGYDDMFM